MLLKCSSGLHWQGINARARRGFSPEQRRARAALPLFVLRSLPSQTASDLPESAALAFSSTRSMPFYGRPATFFASAVKGSVYRVRIVSVRWRFRSSDLAGESSEGLKVSSGEPTLQSRTGAKPPSIWLRLAVGDKKGGEPFWIVTIHWVFLILAGNKAARLSWIDANPKRNRSSFFYDDVAGFNVSS